MFDVGRWMFPPSLLAPGRGTLPCNGRSCSQAAMKFFGVRPYRPQQGTPGRALGIAPTPPGCQRCSARGRAHSGFAALCSKFKVRRFDGSMFKVSSPLRVCSPRRRHGAHPICSTRAAGQDAFPAWGIHVALAGFGRKSVGFHHGTASVEGVRLPDFRYWACWSHLMESGGQKLLIFCSKNV